MESTSTTLNTAKVLYNIMLQAGAKEAHTTGKGIFMDNDASLVLSVYKGQKPSHEILDDLVIWLEGTNERLGRKKILDKIIELSEMER